MGENSFQPTVPKRPRSGKSANKLHRRRLAPPFAGRGAFVSVKGRRQRADFKQVSKPRTASPEQSPENRNAGQGRWAPNSSGPATCVSRQSARARLTGNLGQSRGGIALVALAERLGGHGAHADRRSALRVEDRADAPTPSRHIGGRLIGAEAANAEACENEGQKEWPEHARLLSILIVFFGFAWALATAGRRARRPRQGKIQVTTPM
jgi:hypothetical protein